MFVAKRKLNILLEVNKFMKRRHSTKHMPQDDLIFSSYDVQLYAYLDNELREILLSGFKSVDWEYFIQMVSQIAYFLKLQKSGSGSDLVSRPKGVHQIQVPPQYRHKSTWCVSIYLSDTQLVLSEYVGR